MSAQSDLGYITIASARLLLRSFTASDAPEIFGAVSLTITRFMAWEPPPSLEEFAKVWHEWLCLMTTGIELHLVVRLASTDEFLGVAGLHGIGNPEPEIGIWIKETAQGLGYGRESIAAIVTWASTHVGTEAFIYPVAEQNHLSRRLVESLNGVVVGARELRKASGAVIREIVYRIPAAAT